MNTQSAASADANVDPGEIAKFDASDKWWNKEGPYKTLHQINPLRRDWIIARTGPISGLKVLDVGCGGGILAESLAEKGAVVTAIDLGQGQIEAARAHADQAGLDIDYQVVSIESMAAAHAGEFDVVTCMELLEHVPDPVSVVNACASLVKPDGHAFFSTLNRNPKSWLLGVVAAEYVLRMVPTGTHEYSRFIKPSELGHWLRQANMTLDDMAGIEYQPFQQTFRITDNVDINYMVHAIPES